MIRARPLALCAAALIGFVAAFLLLRFAQRNGVYVQAAFIVPVLVGAFAVVVLALGWRVRQFVGGRTSMEPVAAARVAALAVSGAFVGALWVGIGAAQVVVALELAGAPAARSDLVIGLVTAVLAAALVAVGLLVQAWCRVREGDDDPPPRTSERA